VRCIHPHPRQSCLGLGVGSKGDGGYSRAQLAKFERETLHVAAQLAQYRKESMPGIN
jgi:hypothetical protein